VGEITEALRRARVEREQRRLEEAAARATATGPSELQALRIPSTAREPVEVEPLRIERKRRGAWQARAVVVEGAGETAERFRHLAVRVRQELERMGQSVLFVTGAERGDGKTLTACNLALALASVSGEDRIGLVDLDLRRRSLGDVFGVSPTTGVEAVLAGEARLSEIRVPTELPGLDLFPAAKSATPPHELLAAGRLQAMFDDLCSRYRFVICDTPPILVVPDVSLIAGRLGACLFVVRAGTSRRAALLDALKLVPRDNVIGIFANEMRSHKAARYGYEAEEDPPRAGRSGWRR
jgi:capsular exopolysaccharide synthesis family protein